MIPVLRNGSFIVFEIYQDAKKNQTNFNREWSLDASTNIQFFYQWIVASSTLNIAFEKPNDHNNV